MTEWLLVNVKLRQDYVTSQWFLIYMWMVWCMKRVLGCLPIVNAGSFEKKQLLFPDHTALTTAEKENLCRLVSLYSMQKIKLRVIFSMSKVMWCSMYGNVGRTNVYETNWRTVRGSELF